MDTASLFSSFCSKIRRDFFINFMTNFTCCIYLYTLAEGIMISVRSLQRSEGDVSDPIKYMFLISITRRDDLAMSVCPSVSTQTSLSALKLSDWNFPKSLLSFAGSIYVGISWIGQLYLIAPIGIVGKKIISLVFFNTCITSYAWK